LNETLLWLGYLLSGVAAFALVHRLGWRIVPTMLVGTAVTVAAWLILFLLADEKNRPEWETLDLSLNTCFGVIFAALGAAVAFFLDWQRRER
jgi:4-hydroxybenzoate polyprenyltransferase